MRFYLDHDVPAQVCGQLLTPAGHDCWTASNAGMPLEGDDEQTVYAMNQNATLISCDVAFSQRRRRQAIGRHVWLKCPKPDAAAILGQHLPAVLTLLESAENVTVTVSRDHVGADYSWS